jgi:hypothetical protein
MGERHVDRTLVIACLVMLATASYYPVASADDKNEAIERDVKAVQGLWVVKQRFKNGKEEPAPDGQKPYVHSILVKEERFRINVRAALDQDTTTPFAPFSLDPQKTSGIVKFELELVQPVTVFARPVTAYARYQVKDGELRICRSEADYMDPKKIPEQVQTKKGDGNYLYVLRPVDAK